MRLQKNSDSYGTQKSVLRGASFLFGAYACCRHKKLRLLLILWAIDYFIYDETNSSQIFYVKCNVSA